MGWASGSELMGEIVGALKRNVKDAKVRRKIYDSIIPAFESADCDTLNECEGTDTEFDAALKALE